jgi:hypothetical protein
MLVSGGDSNEGHSILRTAYRKLVENVALVGDQWIAGEPQEQRQNAALRYDTLSCKEVSCRGSRSLFTAKSAA